MHIIWKGHSYFQILTSSPNGEQISLVIDPFDEKIGIKVPKVKADILLISHDHYDHNNKKAVKDSPFLIDGAGEYEIKGIFIRGIPAFHDDSQGKERGKIVIFTIETEEMRLCHLGDFGQKELTPEQLEKIGNIDILMIPVGGVYTISAKEASKIISQLEPKIIIPMHYQIPKLKLKKKLESLNNFLKEMEVKSVDSQKKLLIKKKDLSEEKTKIVVLEP
jgi:L-ascorbate metabolism protein UlaG (beta-lactamase superfamily)